MELVPPTYNEAVCRNHLRLVAPYLRLRELCSAALVSAAWHETFVTSLWADPGRFNSDIQRISGHGFLYRFLKCLRAARHTVRSRTHTLRLDGTSADLYEDLGASWLWKISHGLPNLQSIVIDGADIFDHTSLMALVSSQQLGRLPTETPHEDRLHSGGNLVPEVSLNVPWGHLKMLDISRCENVTVAGLVPVLWNCGDLIYLNLSHMKMARDVSILDCLSRLRNLQVLRLCGVALRDEACTSLAIGIGRRVRSLDLSGNLLTDAGIDIIIRLCLAQTQLADLQRLYENLVDQSQQTISERLWCDLTATSVDQMALEAMAESGVVELSLGGNNFSIQCVDNLLSRSTLHFLDIGNPAIVSGQGVRRDLQARPHDFAWISEHNRSLIKTLYKHATRSLLMLRVHHTFITGSHGCHQKRIDEKHSVIRHIVDVEDHVLHQRRNGSRSPERSENDEKLPPYTVSVPPPLQSASQMSELHDNPVHQDAFHPMVLPGLRAIVLSGLPAVKYSDTLLPDLLDFVKMCRQSGLAVNSVSPGGIAFQRNETTNMHTFRSPHLAPSFRKIVFEFDRPLEVDPSVNIHDDGISVCNAIEEDFSFFPRGS